MIIESKQKYTGASLITTVVVFALVIVAFFVMNLMGVKAALSEEDLQIKAPMFQQTIKYSEIQNAEKMTQVSYGKRTFGLGIPGLQTGNFRNELFGDYKCAIATSNSDCIVIQKSDGSYIVFNIKSSVDLETLYQTLQQKIAH